MSWDDFLGEMYAAAVRIYHSPFGTTKSRPTSKGNIARRNHGLSHVLRMVAYFHAAADRLRDTLHPDLDARQLEALGLAALWHDAANCREDDHVSGEKKQADNFMDAASRRTSYAKLSDHERQALDFARTALAGKGIRSGQWSKMLALDQASALLQAADSYDYIRSGVHKLYQPSSNMLSRSGAFDDKTDARFAAAARTLIAETTGFLDAPLEQRFDFELRGIAVMLDPDHAIGRAFARFWEAVGVSKSAPVHAWFEKLGRGVPPTGLPPLPPGPTSVARGGPKPAPLARRPTMARRPATVPILSITGPVVADRVLQRRSSVRSSHVRGSAPRPAPGPALPPSAASDLAPERGVSIEAAWKDTLFVAPGEFEAVFKDPRYQRFFIQVESRIDAIDAQYVAAKGVAISGGHYILVFRDPDAPDVGYLIDTRGYVEGCAAGVAVRIEKLAEFLLALASHKIGSGALILALRRRDGSPPLAPQVDKAAGQTIRLAVGAQQLDFLQWRDNNCGAVAALGVGCQPPKSTYNLETASYHTPEAFLPVLKAAYAIVAVFAPRKPQTEARAVTWSQVDSEAYRAFLKKNPRDLSFEDFAVEWVVKLTTPASAEGASEPVERPSALVEQTIKPSEPLVPAVSSESVVEPSQPPAASKPLRFEDPALAALADVDKLDPKALASRKASNQRLAAKLIQSGKKIPYPLSIAELARHYTRTVQTEIAGGLKLKHTAGWFAPSQDRQVRVGHRDAYLEVQPPPIYSHEIQPEYILSAIAFGAHVSTSEIQLVVGVRGNRDLGKPQALFLFTREEVPGVSATIDKGGVGSSKPGLVIFKSRLIEDPDQMKYSATKDGGPQDLQAPDAAYAQFSRVTKALRGAIGTSRETLAQSNEQGFLGAVPFVHVAAYVFKADSGWTPQRFLQTLKQRIVAEYPPPTAILREMLRRPARAEATYEQWFASNAEQTLYQRLTALLRARGLDGSDDEIKRMFIADEAGELSRGQLGALVAKLTTARDALPGSPWSVTQALLASSRLRTAWAQPGSGGYGKAVVSPRAVASTQKRVVARAQARLGRSVPPAVGKAPAKPAPPPAPRPKRAPTVGELRGQLAIERERLVDLQPGLPALFAAMAATMEQRAHVEQFLAAFAAARDLGQLGNEQDRRSWNTARECVEGIWSAHVNNTLLAMVRGIQPTDAGARGNCGPYSIADQLLGERAAALKDQFNRELRDAVHRTMTQDAWSNDAERVWRIHGSLREALRTDPDLRAWLPLDVAARISAPDAPEADPHRRQLVRAYAEYARVDGVYVDEPFIEAAASVLAAERGPLQRTLVVVYRAGPDGYVVSRRYPDTCDPPEPGRILHLYFLRYGHYQSIGVRRSRAVAS